MFSLNFANMALCSAIALVPQAFSEQVYDEVQSTLKANPIKMPKQLKEAILVSDTLIGTFYRIASQDHSVFEAVEEVDLAILFQQSKQLIEKLNHRINFEDDLALLANFEKTLTDTEQLMNALEYKKEADRILLSRTNSSVSASFDENTTEEELHQFIFG